MNNLLSNFTNIGLPDFGLIIEMIRDSTYPYLSHSRSLQWLKIEARIWRQHLRGFLPKYNFLYGSLTVLPVYRHHRGC